MVALLRFCLIIIASKMLIFEIHLALKEPLVATFYQTRPLTSRKYVVALGRNILKSSKRHKLNSKGSQYAFKNSNIKKHPNDVDYKLYYHCTTLAFKKVMKISKKMISHLQEYSKH